MDLKQFLQAYSYTVVCYLAIFPAVEKISEGQKFGLTQLLVALFFVIFNIMLSVIIKEK